MRDVIVAFDVVEIDGLRISGARWKGRNTGAFKMDLLRRRFVPTIH